jgi:hypothetical protein
MAKAESINESVSASIYHQWRNHRRISRKRHVNNNNISVININVNISEAANESASKRGAGNGVSLVAAMWKQNIGLDLWHQHGNISVISALLIAKASISEHARTHRRSLHFRGRTSVMRRHFTNACRSHTRVVRSQTATITRLTRRRNAGPLVSLTRTSTRCGRHVVGVCSALHRTMLTFGVSSMVIGSFDVCKT